ncbi:hypothetical protein Slin15195_G011240 [Septoria linicola]|uniref:SWI5-dependent HO expression protein 3 n=1 Tax=Septoria linicola TaxID=215465 RepID=A0A9Q9EEF1_9PEZI|nr:hypothetical protein Slin14017_G011250 [Septoria linicola]USW47805.1 hypothetical protein Slin15195_G011240 [Septoria linicola]
MNGSLLLSSSPEESRSPFSGNLRTPTQNGSARRSSGGGRESSPQVNGNTNGQNAPPSPLSPPTDAGQWSSAIGHATTGGKSGRVIEKLMADNDRFKRELKEQMIKAEELQRSLQMFKPRMESLQAENDNLSHARDVDLGLLARRERIITELKADLARERERSKAFEDMAQKCTAERDEAVEEKRRDVQSMAEQTKHAQVHTEILESSHRQLNQQYGARIEGIRTEVIQLQQEREEDRKRLSKMDVVSDQMRQELERTRKLQSELVNKWEELQQEKQERFQELERETKVENEKVRQLSTEMDHVVNKMRWVMNVKRNTRLDCS